MGFLVTHIFLIVCKYVLFLVSFPHPSYIYFPFPRITKISPSFNCPLLFSVHSPFTKIFLVLKSSITAFRDIFVNTATTASILGEAAITSTFSSSADVSFMELSQTSHFYVCMLDFGKIFYKEIAYMLHAVDIAGLFLNYYVSDKSSFNSKIHNCAKIIPVI